MPFATVLAVAVLVAMGLGGCAADELEAGDHYLSSLGDALDRPISWQAENLPPFPRPRSLALTMPRTTIDVVEFAQLHSCDLGGLIGARNSALGRVQQASTALAYEVAWLRVAATCEGFDWLPAAVAEKRQRLPTHVWNATFAGPELAQAMGLAAGTSASVVAAAPLLDLARLIEDVLVRETLPADLEERLRRLAALPLGQRRNGWARDRARLEAATAALIQREPPVCLSGKPTNRSLRVVGVMHRFYIDEWQGQLAAGVRADEAWLAGFDEALAPLRELAPDAFEAFYRSTFDAADASSEWARTKSAIVRHAQAWQTFHEGCGMRVGER